MQIELTEKDLETVTEYERAMDAFIDAEGGDREAFANARAEYTRAGMLVSLMVFTKTKIRVEPEDDDSHTV